MRRPVYQVISLVVEWLFHLTNQVPHISGTIVIPYFLWYIYLLSRAIAFTGYTWPTNCTYKHAQWFTSRQKLAADDAMYVSVSNCPVPTAMVPATDQAPRPHICGRLSYRPRLSDLTLKIYRSKEISNLVIREHCRRSAVAVHFNEPSRRKSAALGCM
jgi:hypothetical protein